MALPSLKGIGIIPETQSQPRLTFDYPTNTPLEEKLKTMGFVPSIQKEQPAPPQKINPLAIKTSTSAIMEQSKETELGFTGPLKLLETAGQGIARSFVATGAALWNGLEESYTPQGSIEKKIFGTDKPISFKTIGEETLMIGGEDFKNKWGKYSVPVGMLIAGLDVTPLGGGKVSVAKQIAKTDDVVKIAKLLKGVVKGSDEEIGILAKSLKSVTKEDEVLKILDTAGTSKVASIIAPQAQKATQKAITAEKGIIPQELQRGVKKIVPISKEELGRAKNIINENTPEQISGGGVFEYTENAVKYNRQTGTFEKLPPKKIQTYRKTPFAGVPEDILAKIKQGGGALPKGVGGGPYQSNLSIDDLRRLGKALTENDYAENAGMVVKGYAGNDVILGTTKINGQMEYIVGEIKNGKLLNIRLHGTPIDNNQIIGRITNIFPEFTKLNAPEIKPITQAVKGVSKTGEAGEAVKPKVVDEFDEYLKREFGDITPREEKQILSSEFQEEADAIKREVEGQLFKDIRAMGGIKSYRGKFMAEELRPIPLNLRNNKTGLPMDELADMLRQRGYPYESDTDLLQAILDIRSEARVGKVKTLQSIRKFAPKEISERAERLLKSPIQRVITALKKAKPLRSGQEALYTKERGIRLARALSVGKKVVGEKGYYAELGQLKGELPKVQFESIRSKIGQEDIDNLFIKIKESPLLGEWDKLNARQGLAKLFGEYGGNVPTEGEITLLQKVFGKDFTKAILDKRSLFKKMMEAGYQLANIPRSVMASFDLSAPLRQGIFLIGRPKQFLPAFVKMFKAFGSEKAYKAMMEEITRKPVFNLIRDSKLALTDMDSILTLREERFMSNWAEKIPGFGKIIRASGRAYTVFLNKLRADVFEDLITKADKLGLNPKTNADLSKEIANFVNTATGRGSLGGLQRASVALNSFFFSPRLMASRLTLLNPLYYVRANPFVRKEALKSLLSFGGAVATVLGLAKMGGAEVGTDWRSSDFGKIKIGNTRIDIMGGFQQYIRMAGQLITGKYVSSTTGKIITLGEGYKPLTRMDILMRQVEAKEAPIFSFFTDLMKGQNYAGQSLDIKTEIGQRFIPMAIGDIIDVYKDDPSLLPLGALGIFGVGIQTYQPSAPKTKGAPSLKMGGMNLPSLKGTGVLK